jgi:AcrR family transcriptional regulator
MSPRTYAQNKRAASALVTRQRILDSTVQLYRDLGVPATTIKAVAERADVSRGTVLHHFGSADGLLGAVLDFVVDQLELPDARVLDGTTDRDARIRTFVEAMLAFTDRSTSWWSMFEGEMQRPELQKREAAYWEALRLFQEAALGPELARNRPVNAVILGLIHPATVGTLVWAFERTGLSRKEAWRAIGDLAVDAVRRLADRGRGKGGLS